MNKLLILLTSLLPLQAMAEACIVHASSESGSEVTLCQQNVNIPQKMFHDSFCQPALKGQKIRVEYAEHCPEGAHGVCSKARSGGTPFMQDIHYYGQASDARILRPYCQHNNQGTWLEPDSPAAAQAGD